MSTHIGALKGQIAEAVLMPGDPLRAKFIAENFLEDAFLYNEVRGMYGYTGRYKGVPVSVQASGMGMPSMGIYCWELMNDYDVQNIVRIGTSGSLREDISVRDIIVAMACSTDSNYGDTFCLPVSYTPTASYELLCKAQEASKNLGIPFKAGNMYCSDVFYDLRDARKKLAVMNIIGVEMEAAALYMNAAYHKRNALCITTVAKNILTGEETTAEEREKTFTDMMILALETVIL